MNKDSFYGTIIGKAVGDSLGFPVEGGNPETCKTFISKISLNDPIPARSEFKAGQITDDTQLALELMISLTENKGMDPSDYADRIGKIFSSQRVVGQGIATGQAAKRIIDGVNIEDTGIPAPSAGNGTAMRVAPVGLFYAEDIDQLIQVAEEQGVITHKDPRCTAGSIIMAGAIAYLVKLEDKLNSSDFIKYLSNLVADISPIFSKSILQLLEVLDVDPVGAARLVSTWGKPDFIDGWKYISPYVIPSVCWSLYAFITNSESYPETVFTAIRAGGDVDTTAAMAGALSGAYLGLDAIPNAWMESIVDHDLLDYSDIIDLIDNFWNVYQN